MEIKMKKPNTEIKDKSLYRFAWFFECFAVAIGMYLAISLSVPGLGVNPELNDWINFGGIVLILMFGAFIELTKIPIIRAFNSTRSIYRRGFMISLFILLCVFTFDTLFQGTEQFIHYREKPLEQQRKAMVFIQEDIAGHTQKYEGLNLISDEEVFEKSNRSLEKELASTIKQIKEAELRKANLSNPIDTPQIIELKGQRSAIERKIESKLQQKNESIKSFNNELSILVKGESEALESASFMQKSRIASEYSERKSALEQRRLNEIEAFDNQANQIKGDLNTINVNINEFIRIQLEPVADLIIKIDNEIEGLKQEKSDLKKGSNKRLDDYLALVIIDRGKAIALKADIESLEDKLQKERNTYFSMAKENNIYRIGEKVFAKDHPADLTREEVALLSMIIMITTAAIFTIVGPSCAYFSLEEKKRKRRSKPAKSLVLRRILRHMMINIIKRVRRPRVVTELKEVEVIKEVEVPKPFEVEVVREVIKEVPVQRIVEVEIPKPFPVTSYVGIPVPKDPEDLIQISNAAELELTPAVALSGAK